MNRQELFIAAMNAENYRRVAWVISAFALISEAPDAWKDLPYPYRIIQTPGGNFYVDPSDTTNLILIPDSKAGEPVYKFRELIELKAGTFINQKEAVKTTYGNVLANHIVLIQSFGAKIPFITGQINVVDIEAIISPKLTKTPKEGESRDPNLFYVDEYAKFANGAFELGAFTQLCVPAHTEKMLTVPPGTKELRDSLLEKYKDRLRDPAAIAEIDKALINHFKQWIKGDRSEGFLITKKSIEIVRKKILLMHGAEMGLMETVDVDLVSNSLREGWDVNKLPAMINSLRAGAFNRGQQTELGGVAVKELLRASANIRVVMEDCGSKLGLDFFCDEENKSKFIGYSAITDKGAVEITEDNFGQYLGKKVTLRSPLYCKKELTDYCSICVGRNLSRTPTAASVAVADYGNRFLLLFLKAAHAKALKTTKLDWKNLIR